MTDLEQPHDDAATIVQAARHWMERDPDPATRASVQKLLDAQDTAALTELFGHRLAFGTAGLRGSLGPGPGRMNQLMVAETAAGLAQFLADQGLTEARVVVGRDVRHGSAEFAQVAATVLREAGLEVHYYDHPLPTPVLAFAVKHHQAQLGVVITASHNPATDNGVKIYLGAPLGLGSQLNTPYDADIAAAILRCQQQPVALAGQPPAAAAAQPLIAAYTQQVIAQLRPRGGALPFVYTALHGVGAEVFAAVLDAAGFTGIVPVATQYHPDGDFPTAAQPNPELPQTLRAAVALAEAQAIPLLLAHDPDADRCAVAVADAGGYRVLNGNEIGMLLAGWLVDTGRLNPGDVVASSLVSHSALPALAAAHGLHYERTLTGFKWIAAVPGLCFGYEEAIGYCLLPDVVADKDGISAALAVLELAHELHCTQRSIPEYLAELADRYGHTATAQLALPLQQVSATEVEARISKQKQWCGLPVTDSYSLTATERTGLPATAGVLSSCGSGSCGSAVTVIARPSGTEPKMKIYLQLSAADAVSLSALKQQLTNQVQQLFADTLS